MSRDKDFTVENSKFKYISLGQGQGPIAAEMMRQGQENGEWICLQNCHLSVSWLPELERILEQAMSESDKIHSDYRLWLTSMPSNKFPVAVLQNSIKLTNEPPRGLRANMLGTYLNVTKDEYEECHKPKAFKKLFFGLAFFHAIIQERRKFGAIGWNIPYSWMNSDLQTSKMQLKMYLEEQEQLPLETLNYMIGEVNYGGRITDDKDERCCRCILKKYMCHDTVLNVAINKHILYAFFCVFVCFFYVCVFLFYVHNHRFFKPSLVRVFVRNLCHAKAHKCTQFWSF